MVRELLSFIPSNNLDDPPRKACTDPIDRMDEKLDTLIPDQSNMPYDMKDVIHTVVDDGYFFEIHEHYAKNIVVGFARLNGKPVGIVANEPAMLAGTLDINASVKGARFVRFCDCFNIPLVTFEDVRVFAGHAAGVWRNHPAWRQVAVCVCGSYRAESDCHYSQSLWRSLLRDVVKAHSHRCKLRWPSAEIAVMVPEGAVDIVYKRELDGAENRDAVRQEKIEEFRERFANPYVGRSRICRCDSGRGRLARN